MLIFVVNIRPARTFRNSTHCLLSPFTLDRSRNLLSRCGIWLLTIISTFNDNWERLHHQNYTFLFLFSIYQAIVSLPWLVDIKSKFGNCIITQTLKLHVSGTELQTNGRAIRFLDAPAELSGRRHKKLNNPLFSFVTTDKCMVNRIWNKLSFITVFMKILVLAKVLGL